MKNGDEWIHAWVCCGSRNTASAPRLVCTAGLPLMPISPGSAQRQSTPNTPHQLRTDASREYMKSSHL